MSNSPSQKFQLDRQLRHDLANDLNSLAMSLEALPLVREDASQFEELVESMRESLGSLSQRLEQIQTSESGK